ncbi:hypothetical protein CVT24_007520 [Panaeolus cyanescens]|uniref:Uncharacterized protein n=1 Tax=Panaeolus cyanescens TaxID=181874 RepID=A0A409W9V5_9AGAR|nr:hypothetical protein CVT24_007520 [Panaeolus cyanescens]
MPDSFFSSSKPKKRKRSDSASGEGRHGTKRLSNAKGRPGQQQGRHGAKVNGSAAKGKQVQSKKRDEELSDQTDEDGGDIDDMDLRAEDVDPGESGDEDEEETPAEKRLRLAQMYLDSIKSGLAEGEFDAADVDKEIISARLKQDVLEHSGKVHLFVADSFDFSEPPTATLRTRGHRFSITSAVAAESGKYLFTSGKEGHINKWDLHTGKRVTTLYKIRPSADTKGKGKARAAQAEADQKGHIDEVLSLALSSDGGLLVSGGRDCRVCVWNAEKGEWVKTFVGPLGHKDAVSNVVFRKGSSQLYTASLDRCVKVYDLAPGVMGYVETLFGHQDHILGLDALRGETCVSVGARDKTARYWKIVDETQLVFRGGGRSRVREVLEGGLKGDDAMDDDAEAERGKEKDVKFVEGSLECVAMIDEATFVSGGDSGSICLWSTAKKKPIFTQPLAHGFNEAFSETEGVIKTPRWITSLASLRYSDIFVSGSWEGDIRIWKIDAKLKSFELVGKLAAQGFVNSLQLITPPKEFVDSASWVVEQKKAKKTAAGSEDPSAGVSRRSKTLAVHPFVLVAGLGQEPRFGRWLSVKEGGAVNATLVAVYEPSS